MATIKVTNALGTAVNQLYTLDTTGSAIGQVLPDGNVIGNNTSSLRLVATRCRIPNAISVGSTQAMSRNKHIAKDTITSIRIVIPNFWVNNSYLEAGSGAVTTCTASLEDLNGNITKITFNSGSTTGQVPDNSYLISDQVDFIIKKDTIFFSRIWVSNPAGLVYNTGYSVPGEGFNISNLVSDLTLVNGVLPQANLDTFVPCAIVGFSDEKCYGLIGDSRMFGVGDVPDNISGDIGVYSRIVGATGAYMNCGKVNESTVRFLASSANRVALVNMFCTDVITNHGLQDIYVDSRPAAEVITNLTSIVSLFPTKRVYGGTIWPVTVSTDGWVSTNNQSYPTIPTTLQNSRVSINAAWRSNVMGNVGIYDAADSIESSRNSGIFAADTGNILGPNLTTDGIHLNARGHRWVVSNTKPGSGIINITTGNALDKFPQTVSFANASNPISYAFGGDVTVGTLTGDLVLVAPIGMSQGNVITFHFQQDAVGGRLVTFPDGVSFWGGRSNNKLVVMFLFDGTDFVQLNQSNWS